MCRSNRITEDKSNCNIYLWCREKKADLILNYIFENTNGFIKDKVFTYNTNKRIIQSHIIQKQLNKDNLNYKILNLNTLKFDNNNINIIIDKTNNIWFNANDIAILLGYKYPKDAIINNVDKENKIKLADINTNNIINKHPHSIYINEEGVNLLLIQSRLEKSSRV